MLEWSLLIAYYIPHTDKFVVGYLREKNIMQKLHTNYLADNDIKIVLCLMWISSFVYHKMLRTLQTFWKINFK